MDHVAVQAWLRRYIAALSFRLSWPDIGPLSAPIAYFLRTLPRAGPWSRGDRVRLDVEPDAPGSGTRSTGRSRSARDRRATGESATATGGTLHQYLRVPIRRAGRCTDFR